MDCGTQELTALTAHHPLSQLLKYTRTATRRWREQSAKGRRARCGTKGTKT
jgi:hypothetical protein